jgi:magnesium transporter
MRVNEVMRTLAVITCIFAPLTFIGGVYGMSFEFMAELKWQHGYLSVWLAVIAVSVGMMLYFKSKKWL